MFRIDAICDRINFKVFENDEPSDTYKDASEKHQEDQMMKILTDNDIRRELTRTRMSQVLNKTGAEAIGALGTVMKIVNQNYEQERVNHEIGFATHLMAILMNLLETSPCIWHNFSEIISLDHYEENVRKTLNDLLRRHQIVFVKILKITRNYFDSLCEFNGQFFIDTTSELLNKKLHSLQLHLMILLVHQLLSIPDIAEYVSQKVFVDFDFNPSFVNYLKLSLSNLTL